MSDPALDFAVACWWGILILGVVGMMWCMASELTNGKRGPNQ